MFLNISGVSINILVIFSIFSIATAGHDHEIKGNGHQKGHTNMIGKRFPRFCADTEIKALAGPHAQRSNARLRHFKAWSRPQILFRFIQIYLYICFYVFCGKINIRGARRDPRAPSRRFSPNWDMWQVAQDCLSFAFRATGHSPGSWNFSVNFCQVHCIWVTAMACFQWVFGPPKSERTCSHTHDILTRFFQPHNTFQVYSRKSITGNDYTTLVVQSICWSILPRCSSVCFCCSQILCTLNNQK